MLSTRRRAAWLLWCAVVFGLWNDCGTHRDAEETGSWLGRGGFPLTPSTAVRAIRTAARNDGDIARYLAYANAVLGRPYQGWFVRPIEGWRVDTRAYDTGRDFMDPAETPPVVPAAPLVPWRDFSVEYPPGFFL